MRRGDFAADNPDRVGKRQLVRITMIFQCRLMHQRPDREMGQQITVKLLKHQLRCFASQALAGFFEMIFDFVVTHFDFPALMIDGGKFGGRSP